MTEKCENCGIESDNVWLYEVGEDDYSGTAINRLLCDDCSSDPNALDDSVLHDRPSDYGRW